MRSLRALVASGRFARIAALAPRAVSVGRHDAQVVGTSLRWLVTSREHTNFTYDLEPLNRTHLSWWVSQVAGTPVDRVRAYMSELDNDRELAQHVAETTASSARRGLMDQQVHFGRRQGWYALVRCLRPDHIVETGTDKGLGTCVLARAAMRNGTGRVTTIDTEASSGSLIGGVFAEVIDRVIGDSVVVLPTLRSVDLLLHDSLHTFEHETLEIEATPLNKSALVLSDNAHSTDALAQWAERTARDFLYFQERPIHHWYPGGGIGAAWHSCNRASRCSTDEVSS